MRTRKEIAESGVAMIPEPENEQFQSIYDSLEIHGLKPGSKQERKKGSKELKISASTVAANDSYIAQKHKFSNDTTHSRSPEALWDIIKTLMAKQIGLPAFETWLAPVQAVEYSQKNLRVSCASDFNRGQILKRYRRPLQRLLSKLTDGVITGLDVVVDESLSKEFIPTDQPEALPVPVVDRRNEYGMRQNPTNNPDIDALLKKHGDMRLIFKESRLFDIPVKRKAQGGWNVDFDALMNFGKRSGLEQVVYAALYVMQEVKQDRSITNPGGLLFSAVKRGCKPDNMQALKAYLK